ncbi:mechanosensitive ion channel family protein [Limisalsivibrio acetivorans]|uniref:mechanosensitive ion channel family protein n=1 Tax=Limisalsivibrio acetivorans TaxID=1304888 RepID=UPI00041C94B4|nr:mechanosensitive ion channel domain-containing protein [Limisalsivibrio acetivorans]
MDYYQNTGLLLQSFIETLQASLYAIIDDFTVSPVNFSLYVVGFAIFYIVLNFYKFRAMKKILNERMENFVHLLSPVLFVVVTQLALEYDNDYTLYIMTNYFGMFWLAAVLLKMPLRGKKGSKNKRYVAFRASLVFTQFFVFLSVVLAFYSDLAVVNLDDITRQQNSILQFASLLSRLSLAIGLNMYIRPVLPMYLHRYADRFPSGMRMVPLNRFLLAGFFLMSLLWVFNIVELSYRFLLGLGLLGLFISLLLYVQGKLERWTNTFFAPENYEEEDMQNIYRHVIRAVYLGSFYIYWIMGDDLLNFQALADNMKDAFIFETSAFSLTVYGLISSIFMFLILRSLLFLFTKYIRNLVSEDKRRGEVESLETIVYNLGVLAVVALVMLNMGITWQIVVPIAGALGIGFGFGLQTILNNYASGFILLFSKKVRIGDLVEISGNAGRLIGDVHSTIYGNVTSIDMFATNVKTFDNIEISVPNSVFISDTIINYTRSDSIIRMRIPVGVAYSSDVELVKSLIMEVMEDTSEVISYRKNEVWFVAYGSSSIDFLALCWVDLSSGLNAAVVRTKILEGIFEKFRENGVEIPFPQRDVWFRNSIPREGEE